MQSEHRGVGLVVTNRARSAFFLQQKDEAYEPHPLGYSFFGGAIEAEEDPLQALERELHEELGSLATTLIDVGPKHVLTMEVPPHGFTFSLYEVVLPGSLALLDGVEVLEGKRGAVIMRNALSEIDFIWGLSAVMNRYLGRGETI